MSAELYWLTLTGLMTGLLWAPYVLNRMVELGIVGTMKTEATTTGAQAEWAARAKRAHYTAVENLVVFAALTLVVHITNTGTGLTAGAAMTYFFAFLTHYVVYTLGIPGLRTVSFLTAFACQMIMGLTALGVL
ncbi:MAG: MAPEG family protein [bacterium]|nr:MAPEG family protein [bacterium]